MPDIIEENEEGEGGVDGGGNNNRSVVARRAQAMRRAVIRAHAAAAAAAVAGNNNNNNNNAGVGAGAVPIAAVPVRNDNDNNNIDHAAAPGAVNNNNNNGNENNDNNNNNNNNSNYNLNTVAGHVSRLIGIDVRPMFRRLGVQTIFDCRYIREKDFDTIQHCNSIQKRKLWAMMKFIANDNVLTNRITLSEISKILNDQKKRERESTSTPPTANKNTAATTNNVSSSGVSAPMVPMNGIKLDSFDGSHTDWIVWYSKTKYTLSQTPCSPLIGEGDNNIDDTIDKIVKKCPGRDYLLFNVLAEAIVGGSARHLIQKAKKQQQQQQQQQQQEQQSTGTDNSNKNNNNDKSKTKGSNNKSHASGRLLWELLRNEYMKGPMAFWILSDARQTLQNMHLIGPTNDVTNQKNDSSSYLCIKNDNNNNTSRPDPCHQQKQRQKQDDDDDDVDALFIAYSVQEYVNRFRNAMATLEEYNQGLPDQFLATTFVEHIYDGRFHSIKKQLLQDLSTKYLSLDKCINELLMTDHMMHNQQLAHYRRYRHSHQLGTISSKINAGTASKTVPCSIEQKIKTAGQKRSLQEQQQRRNQQKDNGINKRLKLDGSKRQDDSMDSIGDDEEKGTGNDDNQNNYDKNEPVEQEQKKKATSAKQD